MSPEDKKDRFTQSVTDAFFGYFSASTAAYTHFTSEALRAWANAVDPQNETTSKPKSWYQPLPPAMRNPTQPTSFPMMFNPWMPANLSSLSASPALPSAFTAWPGAMALISAGVPRNVAWPLAEANSASQDASAVAIESLNDAFAFYRSDGVRPTDKIKAANKRPAETVAKNTSTTTKNSAYANEPIDIMETWNNLSEALATSWMIPNPNLKK